MLKIIAACGNGMGTSMIIKLKVENILKKHNIKASVEAISIGEALGRVNSADVIICSKHLKDQLTGGSAQIASVTNLMDEAEVEKSLLSAIK